jgi:Tol biopolymer transport system component
MANPGDNWDLYIVNSDGANVRRLTDDPAIEGLPAWSPDGKWLAFLSNRGGKWGIWLLHLATKETRQIFSLDSGSLTPPNRSPYEQRDWYDEQLSWSK